MGLASTWSSKLGKTTAEKPSKKSNTRSTHFGGPGTDKQRKGSGLRLGFHGSWFGLQAFLYEARIQQVGDL